MLKFLIVDDSRSARAKLETILGKYGRCRMAEDGKQAVELMESALRAGHNYDLVAMDLEMPVLDGHAAIKEIRLLEDKHNLSPEDRAKMVVVTSRTDPQTVLRVHYDDHAQTYISKPYDSEEIEQTLVNLGLVEPPDGGDHEGVVAC